MRIRTSPTHRLMLRTLQGGGGRDGRPATHAEGRPPVDAATRPGSGGLRQEALDGAATPPEPCEATRSLYLCSLQDLQRIVNVVTAHLRPRVAYSVREAATMVGAYPALIRREIRAGRLAAKRVGDGPRGRILVAHDDLVAWVRRWPAVVPGGDAPSPAQPPVRLPAGPFHTQGGDAGHLMSAPASHPGADGDAASTTRQEDGQTPFPAGSALGGRP